MSYLPETHGAAVYADVTSANIVGYMGSELAPDNFNMIAFPFNTVDGKGINLNTDLKIENHTETDETGACDYISIWEAAANGYVSFYFYSDEGKWCFIEDDRPFEDLYEDGLPAGSAMWYEAYADAVRGGALKITYSGSVESEDDVTYNLAADNFNMIANPFPMAFNLNDANAVVIENHTATEETGDCDYISIWEAAANGYVSFYFYSDEGKWCFIEDDRPFEDLYENGLPAGTPFWYEAYAGADRAGDLTIKFINPIKK